MAEEVNVKRIKMDVVNRLNENFKVFSKLLQDSTMDYALFRGCISPVDEDQFLLELLASDERGNWRKLDLQCDFSSDEIIYEHRVKPFKNTRKLMLALDNIINDLDKIPVSFAKIYFDLNHTIRFKNGILAETPKMDVVLLDNRSQSTDSYYCFSDASSVVPDWFLTGCWTDLIR